MPIKPSSDDAIFQTLQALPDAALVVNAAGIITFLNAKAERLTGYEGLDLVGKSIDQLVPLSNREGHPLLNLGPAQTSSALQISARNDVVLQCNNGKVVPVDISLNPVSGSDQESYLAVIRDITARERKSKEEILVSEIGRIVNSDLEIQDVYRAVADSLPALVKYDRLAINLNDPSSDLVHRDFVSGITVPGGEAGTEGPPPTDVRTAPGPILGSSLAGRPVGADPLMKAMAAVGLNSWVEVPLGNPEEPIGFLSLRSFEIDAYGRDDLNVLVKVAAYISPAIENGLLYAQAQQEARESSALAEISRIITSTSEIEDVYNLVAAQIQEIVPFDRIVVATIDRSRNLVTDRYVAGMIVEGGGSNVTYPLGASAVGEMINDLNPRSLNTVEIEDFATRHPADRSRIDSGLKSMLSVPLTWNDELIGRLILRSMKENAYGEAEAAITVRIANQISGAVANAELVERTLRESEEKAVLAEISQIITSTSEIEKVYDLTSEQIRNLIPFDRIVISLIDEGSGLIIDRYVSGIQIQGIGVGSTFPLEGSLTKELIKDHRPRWFSHFEVEEHRYPGHLSFTRGGLKSMVIAPLVWNGQVIARLALHSKSEDAYTQEDALIVQKIANQISGAVANADMLEQTRRESEERAALAQIGRIINGSTDIHATYPQFAAILRSLVAVDRMSIGLLSPDHQTYKAEFIWENGKLIPVPTGELPVFGTPLEEIIKNKSAVLLSSDTASELAEKYESIKEGLDHGTRSGVGVPLVASDEIIGFLTIGSSVKDAYTPTDVDRLERIASQIAGAIASARSHGETLESQRALMAVEAEKRELELLDEQRAHFLSTVSHELKTPLTSLVAFADILARNREANLTSRQLQQIEVMQRGSRRLDLLINDLLDVSRLDAGTFTLTRHEFDVKVLIEELRLAFGPLLEPANQTLNISVPDHDIWIDGDRDRVAQVITNLLTNALKYSLENTEIRLDVATQQNELTLTVSDAGIGMSQESLAQIFTLFYRSNDAHTQSQQGSGLGMSIVKSIVDLHGGTIDVSSNLGIGTVVTVLLPDCTDAPSLAYLPAHEADQFPIAPISRLAPSDF